MFGDIGAPELLIILAIVVLLFGAGRVGRIGKDLGTAVKDFRKAVSEDEPKQQAATVQQPPAPLPQPVATPAPTSYTTEARPAQPAAPQAPAGPDQRPPAVF